MMEKKILVVEDHKMNMELICDLLEADGFTPIKAFDAAAAFEVLKSEIPALILMDIALPGIDGIEATRLIKNDPETLDIPIVAVTASSMRIDREELIQAGCMNVVYKPIDFAELREAISEAVS